MNRTELVLAMSATLFAAFVLGWLLRWAFSRLNQVNSVDVAEIDHLATRLHDAELALAETKNALVQKEAELDAAMEGLGMARRETSDFQDALESLRADMQQAAPAAPMLEVAPEPVVVPVLQSAPEPEPAPVPTPTPEPKLAPEQAAQEPAPAKPKAKRAPRKPAAKRKPTAKRKTASKD